MLVAAAWLFCIFSHNLQQRRNAFACIDRKTNESLSSVIPITAIVLLLSISIAPLTPGADFVPVRRGASGGGHGPVHPGR